MFPVNCATQKPTAPFAVPAAFVPTTEKPLGKNVNLLLPAERFVLLRSVTAPWNVWSRRTVLTPFLVITAIQRLPSVAVQVLPSVLGHTATRARLLIALARAVCNVTAISLAADDNLLLRMKLDRLGTASVNTIAATDMVTNSSIRVNPRSRRAPSNFRLRRSMALPPLDGGSTHPRAVDGGGASHPR
ncbi:hypothetical protein ASD72_01555 [Pseudoxanthomonas sp. Root630]|nr:hypothetical protein ASD72_01555 [Pseudoxanthomonas sp. Root630]